MKIVYYVNQFFGGIGAEEHAGARGAGIAGRGHAERPCRHGPDTPTKLNVARLYLYSVNMAIRSVR